MRNFIYTISLAGLLILLNLSCNQLKVSPTAVAHVDAPPTATANHPPAAAAAALLTVPDNAQIVWVDPVNGDDGHTGDSRATALRTFTEAWNRIPQGTPLTQAYQIMLMAGNYPESSLPNYLESRYGTAVTPIWVQAADGPGTAVFQGDLNIYDSHYLIWQAFQIIPDPPGDVFHCELCRHITLRDMVLNGGNNRQAHETVKINQSQYIFIENSDISGAGDNAIDYVSVQHGHITGSRIHNAGDWCVYAKGGSAYLRVEGNEIYNCGTGGFTAGQGTGLEFMTSPWLHYEAYDIKVINNLIHDTIGAGLGVNGGYNILLAYNTLYRVGQNSHALEVVYGLRSCDGNQAACQAYLAEGGWGMTAIGEEGESIPNRNIFVLNNLIYNPVGYQSQWQHFAIYGPRTPAAGSNLPTPIRTDENLIIRGNLIWNGPADLALGVEESDQGCQPDNPTCNQSQLLAENWINQFEPQLTNPAADDFTPLANGNVYGVAALPLPAFTWSDAPSPPLAPVGDLTNFVARDFHGSIRASNSPVGAFAGMGAASFHNYLALVMRDANSVRLTHLQQPLAQQNGLCPHSQAAGSSFRTVAWIMGMIYCNRSPPLYSTEFWGNFDEIVPNFAKNRPFLGKSPIFNIKIPFSTRFSVEYGGG